LNQFSGDWQASPCVAGIVRRKAKRLVGQAGLTQQDLPDIEQDILTVIAAAIRKFDPAQSPLPAFVYLLATHAAARLIERRVAERRNASRPSDKLPDCHPDRDRRTRADSQQDQRACEARLDLEAVLSRLDPQNRQLLFDVLANTIAAVARERGIPRTTLNDRVRLLRKHLRRTGLGDYL